MRIRGNCLVLIFSCFFFIILSNVAKILYVNYVYLPNPTALPQSQQKHPLFLRKRCRVDNLKNCIQNTSTTLWVDIEIPVDGEYTPWTEPSEVGTPSSSSENKTINHQQVKAFLDAKNLSQNAVELEAPTPPGYIEVGRLHPKKEKKKIKVISGPLYLDNPHSPERLRNRLKSFPNNSEMLTFVKRQEDRKWFELEYCARFNKDKNNKHLDRHAYDSIIIDREYCITFCPIYKAASTSWLVNLLTLKGMWKPGKEKPKIQPLVTHAFQRVSTLAAPWASKGTTKFTIVRHPFHRLISCYRDKFRDARKLYYYQRYGEKMVRAFRPLPNGISSDEIQSMVDEVRRILNSSEASEANESLPPRGNIYANPIGPTFEEFVKFVVSFKHDDEHWRPFYIQCSICQVQYDFVLRSENLSSDSKLFAEYLNQTNVIETGWENPTSDGATNEDRVCEYFKEIDNRLFEKLISKYKVDFDLFHYEADSYRKCVKDYKSR